MTGLSEEELFKRLFQQRHDPDPALLSIGQACSLIYSFEGEKLDGDGAELPALGSLVGKYADEIYAGVAELQRRDLVQARAQWRAVLPHAVANRLAKLALQNIPPARVRSVLVDNASERMLRSFSRRLGYLDDSKEAKAITEAWLAPGGLLSDVAHFNELGRAIFTNIAPLAPEPALSALEKVLSGADEAALRRCMHFVRLLRSLAYEPKLFERALALLVKLAALLSEDDKDNEAAGVVESLFHITLSGTHAPVAMRIKAADALLGSDDSRLRALGVKALEALMKTSFFSSHYEFEFGARSRDYGYHPRNGEEVRAWFDAVLQLTYKYAPAGGPVAGEVQKALAREFRGLWSNAGQGEELDKLARDIAATSFWRDGWIAARQTRSYKGKGMDAALRDRLTALEEFLRPKDLVSQVRGLVIGPRTGSLDLDDFEDDEDEEDGTDPVVRYEARAAAAICNLGYDLAADENAFKAVLPELMGGNAKASTLGEALAEAVERPRATWDAIVAQFAATERPGIGLLGGYLQGLRKRDADLADTLLDETLEHPVLAEQFPLLQASVEIDARALCRLHRALEAGKADIRTYYNLAYGRATDGVSAPEFRNLVLAIVRKSGGVPVGLEMVSMRLHADASAKRKTLPEVREAGRIVLEAFEFRRKDGRTTREDHQLGLVAKASLAGPEGIPVARRLCRGLMDSTAKHEISGYDHDDLMSGLLAVHPHEVLDELFPDDAKVCKASVRLLQSFLRFQKSVLDGVPDDIILSWCDGNPSVRYLLAASVVLLFKRPGQNEPHEWTPLAGKLLQHAPDPRRVLNEIIHRLHPMSWSGSLATKLEGRLRLLNKLPGSEAPPLAETMAEAREKLQEYIDAQRRREQEEDRAQSNLFE